jgi:L-asparagine transporter-like permease
VGVPSSVRSLSNDAKVTPPDLHSFFAASASVAGALIGLLFVAISVAHERLTAENAAQAHRVRASAALTAFINALTVALFALLPGEKVGWAALVVAVTGLLFIVASLLSLWRVRSSQPGELRDALFLVSLVIVFALQLLYGLRVVLHPHNGSEVENIAILVTVCFFIGIARSWELIGGPSLTLRHEVTALVRARGQEAGDEPRA